jgi:hypothetical protein
MSHDAAPAAVVGGGASRTTGKGKKRTAEPLESDKPAKPAKRR